MKSFHVYNSATLAIEYSGQREDGSLDGVVIPHGCLLFEVIGEFDKWAESMNDVPGFVP